MMNEPIALHGTPVMQRLFQSIEHKARVRRPRCPPADDATGKDIDDERDVDKALPCGHVSKVGDPQRIRLRCLEQPIDAIQRARRGLVADRGFNRFAADNALKSHVLHQSYYCAAGDIMAFTL